MEYEILKNGKKEALFCEGKRVSRWVDKVYSNKTNYYLVKNNYKYAIYHIDSKFAFSQWGSYIFEEGVLNGTSDFYVMRQNDYVFYIYHITMKKTPFYKIVAVYRFGSEKPYYVIQNLIEKDKSIEIIYDGNLRENHKQFGDMIKYINDGLLLAPVSPSHYIILGIDLEILSEEMTLEEVNEKIANDKLILKALSN